MDVEYITTNRILCDPSNHTCMKLETFKSKNFKNWPNVTNLQIKKNNMAISIYYFYQNNAKKIIYHVYQYNYTMTIFYTYFLAHENAYSRHVNAH